MGGSSGSSGAVNFPKYQKNIHENLLTARTVTMPEKGMIECLNDVLGASPFQNWVDIKAENLMFGAGYTDTSFPALFDMFGKFMAGLDIEVLWSQIYEETVDGPEIQSAIAAHANDLSYDIETIALPRFHGGMRDINAVQSTGFMIGRAIIENQRMRDLTKFAAQIRTHALDIAQGRWDSHLNWNKAVVGAYADLVKLFYQAKMDTESLNMDFRGKDVLWDIRAFEYPKSMLGALQGGALAGGGQEVSQVAKSISGTAGGAAAGAMIGAQMGSSGGPWGAVIGGVIGLAASFF